MRQEYYKDSIITDGDIAAQDEARPAPDLLTSEGRTALTLLVGAHVVDSLESRHANPYLSPNNLPPAA